MNAALVQIALDAIDALAGEESMTESQFRAYPDENYHQQSEALRRRLEELVGPPVVEASAD